MVRWTRPDRNCADGWARIHVETKDLHCGVAALGEASASIDCEETAMSVKGVKPEDQATSYFLGSELKFGIAAR